jgi:hypothetical protein
MTTEVRLEEDIVTNIIIIWDCTGENINHIKMFTPTAVKKWDSCMVRVIIIML